MLYCMRKDETSLCPLQSMRVDGKGRRMPIVVYSLSGKAPLFGGLPDMGILDAETQSCS